jgi:hypothetical protein
MHTDINKTHLYISSNNDLSSKLSRFFKETPNQILWEINTSRQTVTPELRNTKMIALRHAVSPNKFSKTAEWNQIVHVANTRILEVHSIFKETLVWIEQILSISYAKNIEIGRVFFSKHLAKTNIDLHIDEGEYFDYFWHRFHFVVQSNEDNIFHIGNEDVKLQPGNLYWINNHIPHYLQNLSTIDRINLIADVRMF